MADPLKHLPEHLKPKAVDLSQTRDRSAVDLSAEAIHARETGRKIDRATTKARGMIRMFKGIVGRRSRKTYVENAMRREELSWDDVERAQKYVQEQKAKEAAEVEKH